MKSATATIYMAPHIPPDAASLIATKIFSKLDDTAKTYISNYYSKRLKSNLKEYGGDPEREIYDLFELDVYCMLSRHFTTRKDIFRYKPQLVLLFDDNIQATDIRRTTDYKVFEKFVEDYTLNLNADDHVFDRLSSLHKTEKIFNESDIEILTTKIVKKFRMEFYKKFVLNMVKKGFEEIPTILVCFQNFTPHTSIEFEYNPEKFNEVDLYKDIPKGDLFEDLASEKLEAFKLLYIGNTIPDKNGMDYTAFRIMQYIFKDRFFVVTKKGDNDNHAIGL